MCGERAKKKVTLAIRLRGPLLRIVGVKDNPKKRSRAARLEQVDGSCYDVLRSGIVPTPKPPQKTARV